MPGGSVLFDTNILLYVLSGDAAKAEKADRLLHVGNGTISVQVLNEFTAVALRQTKRDWQVVRDQLASFQTACQVVPLSFEVHEEGLRIAERYGFSIYDSMIVAAANLAGCDTLYSEDLQDGQRIGGLTVANPFKAA